MIEIIREYRLRADLTLDELAKLIGLKHHQTLQKNLTGISTPNERTAFKYSEFIRKNRAEIENTLGHELSDWKHI